MNNIKDNIRLIKNRIELVSLSAGRNPNDVKLMLATKTVPAAIISEALGDSHTLIGENKIQELKAKHSLLLGEKTEFHFIGHLQTNKIKEAVLYADCIESVDRMDLVKKLNQRLQ